MALQRLSPVAKQLSRTLRAPSLQIAVWAPAVCTGVRSCASVPLEQSPLHTQLESLRGAFRSRRFHPDRLKQQPLERTRTHVAELAPALSSEQLTFSELLQLLELQYGLSAQFVEKQLQELAEILGYQARPETVLTVADAAILMEEVGAPGCQAEDVRRYREARAATSESCGAVEAPEEVDDDSYYKQVVEMLRTGKARMQDVYISTSPKLRMRR